MTITKVPLITHHNLINNGHGRLHAWPPRAEAMAAPRGTAGHVSMNANGGTTLDTSSPMIRKMKFTLTLACKKGITHTSC